MIVFTGCARGGTTYISELMQSIGIEIGHERIGRDGVAAWQIIGDPKKSLPIGLKIVPKSRRPKGCVVRHMSIQKVLESATAKFHQTRDPLKVIHSLVSIIKGRFFERVAETFPIDKSESLYKQAIQYWYFNNLAAEKVCDYSYRVENIENEINIISSMIGKDIPKEIVKQLPTNVNACVAQKGNYAKERKEKYEEIGKITWEDVRQEAPDLYEKVRELAIKYGYK